MDKSFTILIVDDEQANRSILEDYIEVLGHKTIVAENGLSALSQISRYKPDMVLLDLMMPVMNGFEVLEHLRNNNGAFGYTPVVVISALEDVKGISQCISLGADDYLIKPFNSFLLKTRIASSLEKKKAHDSEELYRSKIEDYSLDLEAQVRVEVQKTSKAHFGIIFALARLTESRDSDTGAHLERIREYSKVLAEQLSTTPKYDSVIDDKFVDHIYVVSPLHDIGKVGIHDDILLKAGKLTEDEKEIMKTHTTIGAEILQAIVERVPDNDLISMGIDIALTHHEKWDGSGYPRGLQGENIPLVGRILTLADVYDALISERCYKKSISPEETHLTIEQQRGKHFDPDVVDVFLSSENHFTLIRDRFRDSQRKVSVTMPH